MDEPHGRELDATDPRCSEIRRCARCGARSVTVETFEDIRRRHEAGRLYFHVCGACGASFHSESVLLRWSRWSWSLSWIVFGAGVWWMGMQTYLAVVAIGAIGITIGCALFARVVSRALASSRNPVVGTFTRDG